MIIGQWQEFITIIPPQAGSGITAAGTVADSNRIPFSLQRFNIIVTPKHIKDNRYFSYYTD
jgi:hypothetical protein